MSSKLEKITYVLLICVCCVSLYILIDSRLNKKTPITRESSEQSLVGQHDASISETAWKGSSTTVVLLLSTSCHFCAESVPLYQNISDLRTKSHKFSVLVVSRDPADKMSEYLKSHGIGANNVIQQPAGFAGISATPCVFVVDANGIIRKAFLGKMNWLAEKELLGELNLT